MKPELKKLLLLNLPYLLFVYLFAKCGQAYRLAAGADASAKLLHLTSGISAAFANPLPSLHPFDLCVGVAGAVAVRLIVYSKGKNAKKYRKGEEYGSARWGTAKDIAPYIDPKFENNILLTQTERLTMTGRPRDPKTARNKNVLVIGGSGSGKTRFYVKPNLMQCFPTSDYPTSFVVTDPKGTLILETGQMFQRAGYRVKILNTINFSKSMPLLKSLGFLPTMPQLNYKISALEQVLDAPELQQTNDRFHGIDDTVTYDHVSFAYQTTQPGPDGKPAVVEDEVLHDISFTAKAGQKTALVGESGSGKSTLAKLLIHYYDPQKGSISIGGQKLCDMSLEALNSRISYVAQDQYLFNTSLLENIRLGRLTATDEEVIEAAKKAQCMEFIEKLPQGIHSMAGDAGKMLSGGQRQRISLARAILKDAPIVVLDEATAYADPENEEKMEAAIAELVKGKTLVVIAHKLPAIMNADQICVIDHGKLVAAGKHQDLICSCPEYQKLWKAAQDSAEWKVHTAKEGA